MKAFKIKNGLQASRYLLSSTTISGSTIDLSLGSMFSTTLSSDPAYTFTNPPASGVAQAFSLEVAGGTTTFTQDSFATTLYTGTGSAQTITNGLDLSTDGGLVWVKWRSGSATAGNNTNHILVDSETGTSGFLESDTTNARTATAAISSFNSNGFTTGGLISDVDNFGDSYASWTFKKQAKFFDIVTYTGDGTVGRVIPHSLNSAVGTVIIKQTNASRDWAVWHRSGGASPGGKLNLTAAFGYTWVSSTSTTSITLENEGVEINGNGQSYVAYLFAHDTASDSRIKCGSYTGAGSGAVDVNLGWGPQFLLIKNTTRATNWMMQDTTRGMSNTSWNYIIANESSSEVASSTNRVVPTATGFTVNNNGGGTFGQSGDNVIYMAIRGDAATDSAITWPTSIKWPAGVAPTTPVPGKKDLFTFLTTDGGTTYYGKKAAEGIA
tara:strand:- start:70 stop:1383 length:1314 start_codon:yes stop_codon:yes gene_type:complete